ncbi:MAG TPA: hypothetical protein DCS19_03820 [Flavobacterium sp.]|nr:hypothetical protein [Flavobacterium sp.]
MKKYQIIYADQYDAIINLKISDMKKELHLIYKYKGKVYQSYKRWSFSHCEKVLIRLGASYWEIG